MSTASAGSTTRSGSPILELLVVFVIVFLAQTITQLAGLMNFLFVLEPPVTTNPWTVVTSVYAHIGIGHLLSNSIALVIFGWPIARATSRLRFHVFFAVTGALAGISQIVLSQVFSFVPYIGPTASAGVLGASGAVFALMGYLLAGNRLSSSLATLVSVPPWVTWVVFFILAVVITIATASPGVALIAHFAGFLIGLGAGRARVLALSSGTRG